MGPREERNLTGFCGGLAYLGLLGKIGSDDFSKVLAQMPWGKNPKAFFSKVEAEELEPNLQLVPSC